MISILRFQSRFRNNSLLSSLTELSHNPVGPDIYIFFIKPDALNVFLGQLEQSNQVFAQIVGFRPRFVRLGHLSQSFYWNANSPVQIDWRPICNASMYFNFTIVGWSFEGKERLNATINDPTTMSYWLAQNITNAFRFSSFITLQTVSKPFSISQMPSMISVMQTTINHNTDKAQYERVIKYSPISLRGTLPRTIYSDSGNIVLKIE